MTFFIGLLTFVLVLVSFVLIFLVLIQLPKKDAGAGVAFGGGATDALFGAGSGTVLTKTTKYAGTIFFVLCILVGSLQSHANKNRTLEFERQVEQQTSQPEAAAPAPATQPTTPTASPLMSQPMSQPTSAPAATPAEPTER